MIHLRSHSFFVSKLIGKLIPLDSGDGSGFAAHDADILNALLDILKVNGISR